MKNNVKIYIVLLLIVSIVKVNGQDSLSKSINITSTFKPVLKSSIKLSFNASFPVGDTLKPRLVYNIPVQKIYPGLTPVTIKPMAFKPDSILQWPAANYFKLGYGNLKTPYISAAISLLSGKSNIIFSPHEQSDHHPLRKIRSSEVSCTTEILVGYNQ